MFKRFLVFFAGFVSLVLGLACLGAVGWLLTAFGTEGAVDIDAGRISGSKDATAIVIDLEQVRVEVPLVDTFGRTDLIVSSDRGESAAPVFVAIGPADIADAFLAGTNYDVAHFDSSQHRWTTTMVNGDLPLAKPNLVMWQSSTQGDPAVLPLTIDPPFTMIIMRTDLAAPVDVQLYVRFTLPHAVGATRIGLGLGVVLVLISIMLFWVAVLVMSKRGRHRKEPSHE